MSCWTFALCSRSNPSPSRISADCRVDLLVQAGRILFIVRSHPSLLHPCRVFRSQCTFIFSLMSHNWRDHSCNPYCWLIDSKLEEMMKSKCRIRARFIGAGFRSIGFHDQLLPAIALILRRCFRGVRLSPRLAARRPLNCKNDSTEMMDSFVNNGCVSFASFFLTFPTTFFSLSLISFLFFSNFNFEKKKFILFVYFIFSSVFFLPLSFVCRACFVFHFFFLSLFLFFLFSLSLSLSFYLSLKKMYISVPIFGICLASFERFFVLFLFFIFICLICVCVFFLLRYNGFVIRLLIFDGSKRRFRFALSSNDLFCRIWTAWGVQIRIVSRLCGSLNSVDSLFFFLVLFLFLVFAFQLWIKWCIFHPFSMDARMSLLECFFSMRQFVEMEKGKHFRCIFSPSCFKEWDN